MTRPSTPEKQNRAPGRIAQTPGARRMARNIEVTRDFAKNPVCAKKLFAHEVVITPETCRDSTSPSHHSDHKPGPHGGGPGVDIIAS